MFQTYAIGIEPAIGSLDPVQLKDIGGSPSNVFIARGGFEGLGGVLQNELTQEVCENRCIDGQ